mmetsp:Transcript_21992/g.73956  ORF Transcript_21992/g.73956 Transcript_21992/m.73956 type:complete len:84 (+) Transcript_21992:24-275(+)
MADLFEELAAKIRPVTTLSNSEKATIYGLYKQATLGDNESAQPSMFSPVERAKWGAWESFKGMSQEEARQKYIETAQAILARS